MGIQIGIVTDTLPHTGFQLFRQPDRNILVLSPFRLGGEPNVRVGVAMITSAPDALAFHEDAIKEMWGRALERPSRRAICVAGHAGGKPRPDEADISNATPSDRAAAARKPRALM